MYYINVDQKYIDPGIKVTYYDVNSGTDVTFDLPSVSGSWTPPAGSLVIRVGGNVVSTPDFIPTGPGMVAVEFSYTDPFSKTSTFKHDVSVNAVSKSIRLELVGSSEYDWPIGKAYVDPGCTLTDLSNPAISSLNATASSTVNANLAGAYNYTYSYNNGLGYTQSITRRVNVKSGLNPILTSISSAIIRNFYTDSDIIELVSSVNYITDGGLRVTSPIYAYRMGHLTFTVSSNSVTFNLVDFWGTSVSSISSISKSSDTHEDRAFTYESMGYTGSMPSGSRKSPVYSRDASIVGNSEVTDVDNIIQNVYGIIFTDKGERIYSPEFGCNINAIPFSLMSTYNDGEIIDTIKADIERWEPRCIVDLARTRVMRDSRSIDIDLTILVPGGGTQTIQLSYNN